MRFVIFETDYLTDGRLCYSHEDHSIFYRPYDLSDCWLVINDVQLGFCLKTLAAKEVVGLFPLSSWKPQNIVLPNYIYGDLLLAESTNKGAHQLTKPGEWQAKYNPDSDIVCFGDDVIEPSDDTIEFAKSLWATITTGGRLKALWFHIDEYVD